MADRLGVPDPVMGLATGGLVRKIGDPDPYWFSEPLFQHLAVHGTQNADAAAGAALGSSNADGDLSARVTAATTIDEVKEIIGGGFIRKLARTLLLEAEDIDASRPVNSYGVDSVVAVEIRTWVLKEAQSDVSVFEILSNVPMEELVGKIAVKSKLVPKGLRAGE